MCENRNKIEEKKEEHSQEVIARKDEKINLQKEMLQVQMIEVDIREKEYNSWARILSSSHCSRGIYYRDRLGEGPPSLSKGLLCRNAT
jgi:hypothetical protein